MRVLLLCLAVAMSASVLAKETKIKVNIRPSCQAKWSNTANQAEIRTQCSAGLRVAKLETIADNRRTITINY
jgi:accessory colonization factor AcfC